MKNFFPFLWEVFKLIVIVMAIVVPIRYFLFQPFFVKGQSMEPSFESGDYLIVDEISYRMTDPKRGEVIVFKYPQDPSQRYIKRIIGLPGEIVEVKDGKVIIFSDKGKNVLDEASYIPSYSQTSGEMQIALKNGEYFVMGDNRAASSDSRRWGPVPRENIIGRVFVRAWPFTVSAKIETPTYQPSL